MRASDDAFAIYRVGDHKLTKNNVVIPITLTVLLSGVLLSFMVEFSPSTQVVP